MAVMLKHVAELRFDDAGQRERRELPFRKEIDTAGFNTFAGAAATEFANEEKFENVMLNRRMVVFIAIVDCGEFFHDDIEAGFFFHFADGREARRIANVSPSAGQSPQSVGALF